MRSVIIFLLLGAVACVKFTSASENKGDDVIVMNKPDNFYRYFLALRLAQLQNQYAAAPEKAACQPIGAFCTYHEDCCSNACPGYWKKCVSG